ncbi:MAG: thioredoxin [Nanoarchaeota archaeon]|nr:thioredoxin [Nanoarchaeota archaeon]
MLELNDTNFEEETSKGTVIIDFFAPWCGPCQMMAPIFEELSSEVEGIKFAKVNTQDNQNLAQKFAVMSIPCFIILKDGKETDRIIGGMPKDVLKEKLENI